MWFKPVGLISINGSGFLSQVKSSLFKYQSVSPRFFSLYVDRFSLQTTFGSVFHTWYSCISSLKLLHDDWSTRIFFVIGFEIVPIQIHISIRLSGWFFIVLLGDEIFDSDWLSTTFRANWQQSLKISHGTTMYQDWVWLSNINIWYTSTMC